MVIKKHELSLRPLMKNLCKFLTFMVTVRKSGHKQTNQVCQANKQLEHNLGQSVMIFLTEVKRYF